MNGLTAFAGACLLAATASALDQTAEPQKAKQGDVDFLAAAIPPALNGEPENAKALLEKVKQRDLERQRVAGQTYLDRLAEDLAKEQKEAETMQANINATTNLQKESSAQLAELGNQRRRMEQVISLTGLRIEAEKLKAEGLQLLSDAQAKALVAMNKRADETNLRSNLAAAEMKLLTQPESAPPTAKDSASQARPSTSELRKKLAASEVIAAAAEKVAREAMRAASSRLELADIAGMKAKRKAATVESDLPAIAERPLDLEEKQPRVETQPKHTIHPKKARQPEPVPPAAQPTGVTPKQ